MAIIDVMLRKKFYRNFKEMKRNKKKIDDGITLEKVLIHVYL